MKKYIILGLLTLVGLSSCQDPELDPLQFENTKQGVLIALRGKAYDYRLKGSVVGEIDSFSISKPENEVLEFDAEYISKDVSNLSKIEIYARFKQENRVKLTTVEGSTFKVASGKRYPYGTIALPLTTILKALGKTPSSFVRKDVIRIESDLVLTDGSVIPASSIVNSSLYEAAHFYPAHSLLYMAGQ